jgi:hypothetical protein
MHYDSYKLLSLAGYYYMNLVIKNCKSKGTYLDITKLKHAERYRKAAFLPSVCDM